MKGVFVTGTDTGVGKTLISAMLVRALDADYWKPVQTGLSDDPGDSAVIRDLAAVGDDRIHPPVHQFQAPLSPHAAAALEGAAIRLEDVNPPVTERPLVVEGAGGVLVPLGEGALMIDLIMRLGLPTVVVARSTLGTINHTLLTLEALRARGVAVAGVVMNGPPSPGNRAAIEAFGAAPVIAEIGPMAQVDAATVKAAATLFSGFRPL